MLGVATAALEHMVASHLTLVAMQSGVLSPGPRLLRRGHNLSSLGPE